MRPNPDIMISFSTVVVVVDFNSCDKYSTTFRWYISTERIMKCILDVFIYSLSNHCTYDTTNESHRADWAYKTDTTSNFIFQLNNNFKILRFVSRFFYLPSWRYWCSYWEEDKHTLLYDIKDSTVPLNVIIPLNDRS